ncbi:MAG: hypothetical protein GX034_06625, partial [Clostridiaceae bacterium]|nr:hypothetical protein [Clostridiaceae bacterium]
MTKHIFKKSSSLILAILLAVIALVIPAFAVFGADKKPVKDSRGMEQNESRAPSAAESALLDLPEGLLDLEDNNLGRGIDQLYIDTEDQSDNLTQVFLHSNPDNNEDDLDTNALEAESVTQTRAPANKAETTAATVPTTAGLTTIAPTTAGPTTATPTTTGPTTAGPTTTEAAKDTFLLAISNPDPSYVGRPVQVEDRAVLEGLIMGEFGNDYTGAVLVAQAIRDTMILTGIYNTGQIAR